jgi:hypothetical protein
MKPCVMLASQVTFMGLGESVLGTDQLLPPLVDETKPTLS